jgi:diguanylate cyclase (GGDEF)-like protein
MDRLLRHVDLITRQRRHGDLAQCVVAALHELVGAQQVSLYRIYPHQNASLAGLVAVADATGVHGFDDGLGLPAGVAPIDQFPRLSDYFRHIDSGGTDDWSGDNATRRIFALRRDTGPLLGMVEIDGAMAIDGDLRVIVNGLLGLMLNCQDVLDYAETDTLTGLLNRKTFDQFLIDILSSINNKGDDQVPPCEWHPARRQAHPGASLHWLGVIDVDHFKQINDRHGHLIGDEVLILIATLMKSTFRLEDKLFRFGGEEFVVLLKPTELDNAERAFERFRRRMEEHSFPQVGRATVSIGFTGIGPNDNPANILGQADEALYWAKGNGRNRTSSYPRLCAEGHLTPRAINTEVDLF